MAHGRLVPPPSRLLHWRRRPTHWRDLDGDRRLEFGRHEHQLLRGLQCVYVVGLSLVRCLNDRSRVVGQPAVGQEQVQLRHNRIRRTRRGRECEVAVGGARGVVPALAVSVPHGDGRAEAVMAVGQPVLHDRVQPVHQPDDKRRRPQLGLRRDEVGVGDGSGRLVVSRVEIEDLYSYRPI